MRSTIVLMAGLCLIALSKRSVAAEPFAQPNIVLILVDDMGYGDIGPFGATKAKTPQLDKFAAEGMKFTSFYATPVCSMSRACLMTGCYNARVSIPGVLFPGSQIGLHSDEVTLAEVVKQKGYATICIGKWHLGHREPFLPTKQGFDSYFGIPYSNDMTIDPQNARFAKDCVFRDGMTEEKARAEAVRHTVPLMRGEEIVEYPADQATLTKRYTAEAVKFIRDHRADPFFVYLPHTMVHAPLAASDRFRGKSNSGLLGDAIEELDWSVGEIMQALKEMQLDEKTLVIFTSDNGAAAGSSAPWRGKKGSNFEGGVREPCMMRWPGRIPAGSTCNQIVGNIDLLPTFAKLVGVELAKDPVLDGRDITPLMFDAQADSVRDTHLYFAANQTLAAIRQEDWKLFLAAPVANPKGQQAKAAKAAQNKAAPSGPVLYNLATDPGEINDVAAEHPEIVNRLKQEAARREAEIKEHRRPAGQLSREN
jgi:arylsulfatase A-like enzyme